MIAELRWPGDPLPDTGIDVRSLELEPGDLAVVDILRRPDVMANLARWNAGSALGEDTRRLVAASSAMAVISVTGGSLTDYARGGAAVQSVWITAQQQGWPSQPISPIFLYARGVEDLAEVSTLSQTSWPVCRKSSSSCRAAIRCCPRPGARDLLSALRRRCAACAIRRPRLFAVARQQGLPYWTCPAGSTNWSPASAAALMAATAVQPRHDQRAVIADLVSSFRRRLRFPAPQRPHYPRHGTRRRVAAARERSRSRPDRRGVLRRGGFASSRWPKISRTPFVMRPDPQTTTISARSRRERAIPQTSLACVPLLSGDITTGTLGFVKIGDREWLPDELNALQGDRRHCSRNCRPASSPRSDCTTSPNTTT